MSITDGPRKVDRRDRLIGLNAIAVAVFVLVVGYLCRDMIAEFTAETGGPVPYVVLFVVLIIALAGAGGWVVKDANAGLKQCDKADDYAENWKPGVQHHKNTPFELTGAIMYGENNLYADHHVSIGGKDVTVDYKGEAKHGKV